MKRMFTILLITFAMLTAVSCGKKEEPIVDDFESPPVLVEETEHEDETAASDVAATDETVPDEVLPPQETEISVEQQKEPAEFSYKLAVLEEKHIPDAKYKTDIWYALETPKGFSLSHESESVQVLKDGAKVENLFESGITRRVFGGYVCTGQKFEDTESSIEYLTSGMEEIITIRIQYKEDASPDDFSFIVSETYMDKDMTSSVDTGEHALTVNTDIDNIRINNSEYLYGESLFWLDDETLLVKDGDGTGGGTGPASYFGFTGDEAEMDTSFYTEDTVLIKGNPEHVKELIENHSKICYIGDILDSEEDRARRYTEEIEPPAGVSMFTTACYDEKEPENIEIVFGCIGDTEKANKELMYKYGIIYNGPDGRKLRFMY